MPTPSTSHNDLEVWRQYCEELGKHPIPKTIFDPLRANISDKSVEMRGFWERTDDSGAPPFNGDRFAEARAPIARAIAAIRMANRVKKADTKRSHLATAITWLDCPHPWQGEATQLEIAAMITEIKQAIVDPSKPLDHLLSNSPDFKVQGKVRSARPSFLRSTLRRLSAARQS